MFEEVYFITPSSFPLDVFDYRRQYVLHNMHLIKTNVADWDIKLAKSPSAITKVGGADISYAVVTDIASMDEAGNGTTPEWVHQYQHSSNYIITTHPSS